MATEHGTHCDLSRSVAANGSDSSTTPSSVAVESASGPGSHGQRLEGATNVGNFPTKLHHVLTELERTEKAHIASWAPHGRCFKVHKPQEFVDQVLGLWFRQTKLASFQRQLNIYGFNRITSGADKGGYYHELFLRGRISLTKSMPRMSIKPPGQQRRSGAPGVEEPNFYRMPYVGVDGPMDGAMPTRSESAVDPFHALSSERVDTDMSTTRASSDDYRVISDMLQARIDHIRSGILSNVAAPPLLSSSLPLGQRVAVSSRPLRGVDWTTTMLGPAPRGVREMYDARRHGLDVYSLMGGSPPLPPTTTLATTHGLGGVAQSLPHADATPSSGGLGGLANAILLQAVSAARERQAATSLGALPLHWQEQQEQFQYRSGDTSLDWDRLSLVAAALAAHVTRGRCGTYP